MRYGWIRDREDSRDIKYTSNTLLLSETVDLRPKCPPVYQQGNLGSCTANSIAGAVQFEKMRQNGAKDAIMPSRLFIYYNEREMEGTVDKDCGAAIRDGIKSVVRQGVCSEDLWPYDTTKFRDKPTEECYNKALSMQVLKYLSLDQDIDALTSCLNEGYPFVFGFVVYEKFESREVEDSGVLQMPGDFERQVGGHAVMAVGYDMNNKTFLIRNSWGEEWGQQGYFTMPFDYVLNNDLADSFWTIRLVE